MRGSAGNEGEGGVGPMVTKIELYFSFSVLLFISSVHHVVYTQLFFVFLF